MDLTSVAEPPDAAPSCLAAERQRLQRVATANEGSEDRPLNSACSGAPGRGHSRTTYFDGVADLLSQLDTAALTSYIELIYSAWTGDRAVYFFGNGGSATTSAHHVCDLMRPTDCFGRGLRVCSVVEAIGTLSALANDFTYEDAFRLMLQRRARPGDLAVAISCSGNSPNVVAACKWARCHEVTVAALTGFDGGELGGIAHVHVNVASDHYGMVEDVHHCIGHMVAEQLREHVGMGDVRVGSRAARAQS